MNEINETYDKLILILTRMKEYEAIRFDEHGEYNIDSQLISKIINKVFQEFHDPKINDVEELINEII